MSNRYFPIKTETACRLKWTWSSVFLNTGVTESCHRASKSIISVEDFDSFHNTPSKVAARKIMLEGKWPGDGCEYCRDIEAADGTSDRQFQLLVPEVYPNELDTDTTLTVVSPAMLEVFFSNTCNFKCVYCSPDLSSAIQQEQERFNSIPIIADHNHKPADNRYQDYVPKFWSWFERNGHTLQRLQVLGGEPLLQRDFFMLLDYFEKYPNPKLEFNIVTNLHLPEKILRQAAEKLAHLIRQQHIKRADILLSVDCWGTGQEYVRYGFDRVVFEKNLHILAEYKILRLGLLSTINSLTINEMPALVQKFIEWNSIQEIYWYMNLVLPNDTSPFSATIFDYSVFEQAIKQVLDTLPKNTWDEIQTYEQFDGMDKKIKEKCKSDLAAQATLAAILDEVDRRRSLNWRSTFPWLEKEISNVV